MRIIQPGITDQYSRSKSIGQAFGLSLKYRIPDNKPRVRRHVPFASQSAGRDYVRLGGAFCATVLRRMPRQYDSTRNLVFARSHLCLGSLSECAEPLDASEGY